MACGESGSAEVAPRLCGLMSWGIEESLGGSGGVIGKQVVSKLVGYSLYIN